MNTQVFYQCPQTGQVAWAKASSDSDDPRRWLAGATDQASGLIF